MTQLSKSERGKATSENSKPAAAPAALKHLGDIRFAAFSEKVYFSSVGRTYDFCCPLCHYRACVSGGTDDGVNCSIQTIRCRNCRELFDVFSRLREKVDAAAVVATPAPAPNRHLLDMEIIIPPLRLVEHPLREFKSESLVRPPATPTAWQEIKLVCPVSKLHAIEPWTDPGRCPRCGNFLEKNGFPYRIWD